MWNEQRRWPQRHDEPFVWQRDVFDEYGLSLELRGRGRDFVDPDGFHPFGGDGVAFWHRHPGIGREHLWSTTASPREKTQEMVFADGVRAGWRVGFCKTVCDATTSIVHLSLFSLISMPSGLVEFQAQ